MKKVKYLNSENFWGHMFVAPQLLGVVLFAIIPIVFSLYICFYKWDFVNSPVFVGLENLKVVFSDEIFYKSIYNTLIFVLVTVPLTLVIALTLALLTNKKIAGLSFYKSAFFLPMVTSSVAIAMVFYWLYAPDFGLLLYLFSLVGIKSPEWLTDPFWTRIGITLMSTWMQTGYYFLIFLAGLKGISETYFEASKMDGANARQRFFKITLPLLSPVTFFAVFSMLLTTFNMFNEAYVLTRGGPSYSTYTLVMYIYVYAFKNFDLGPAAIASWVLFIIVGLFTLIQFKISQKLVNYDV